MSMGALAHPAGGNSAHGLRKKLWLGAGALTLLVLSIVIGNSVIDRERAITADAVGHDFLAFYTAGHFLREGQPKKMYDLEAVRKFQKETGESAGLELKKESFGPFWNPPFYAWVFAPLAGMPFRVALSIWWSINLMCLGGAMLLMCRMLPKWCDWRALGLVPVILLNSLAFHQALNHGQNTFVSLLIVAVTVTFWLKAARGESKWAALWAGMSCGLLFYKPQLGAVVALVLVVHLRWKALAGVMATGLALLGVTLWTMPGMVQVYLAKMPGNLAWMQEANSYLWERHVTFKAMWRLLLQGHATGEATTLVKILWVASVATLAGGLGWGMYRAIKSTNRPMAAGRLISAAIASMPLLMPFYFDYDLLLLSVALVVFAAEMVGERGEMRDEDKWLVRAWVVLFVVMFFNASVSGLIRVHLAALGLTVVALLHIRRAWRVDEVVVSEETVAPPIAAAA